VDGLAEVVELPVRLGLRALDRLPRGIRDVGEQGASLTDALSVGAVFELDPFCLQEFAEVAIEFVFVDGFHSPLPISLER